MGGWERHVEAGGEADEPDAPRQREPSPTAKSRNHQTQRRRQLPGKREMTGILDKKGRSVGII